ncbi:hypothetical protein BAX93_05600 [Elizabethkingia meningoseptica]|uniref:hypothetical protein n=1 Tax=Elizabethkingia meningoseptica TaxID=238 RepID=UPI000998F13F|nr:hypothetical protein [Elizabethkingia meningoseptica]OPC11975.1 hypothetical protein BAX93_05600 [Elizabethkingia meningoseptica]
MKPILIIISCLLVFGCRSRKLDRRITSEIKQSYEKVVKEDKQDSVVKNTQKTEHKIQDKETEKSQNTNVEIKGKTETGKPFKVHQVENGDTISSIMITGNADFIIKSNSRNTDKKQEKEDKKENLNELQKLSREAVSQETISKAANEVKDLAEKVKSTGLQFGAYAVFFLWGLAIIVIMGLIVYFRKSTFIKNIIEKFRK